MGHIGKTFLDFGNVGSGLLVDRFTEVLASAAPTGSNEVGTACRQRRKQRSRHLSREFLEYAYRTRVVSIARVNHRQIKGAEVPFGHNLDEPTVGHQIRLHDWRQVPMPTPASGAKARPTFIDRNETLSVTPLLSINVQLFSGLQNEKPSSRCSRRSCGLSGDLTRSI